MRNRHLAFSSIAIAALWASACGTDFSGTFEEDASSANEPDNGGGGANGRGGAGAGGRGTPASGGSAGRRDPGAGGASSGGGGLGGGGSSRAMGGSAGATQAPDGGTLEGGTPADAGEDREIEASLDATPPVDVTVDTRPIDAAPPADAAINDAKTAECVTNADCKVQRDPCSCGCPLLPAAQDLGKKDNAESAAIICPNTPCPLAVAPTSCAAFCLEGRCVPLAVSVDPTQ